MTTIHSFKIQLQEIFPTTKFITFTKKHTIESIPRFAAVLLRFPQPDCWFTTISIPKSHNAIKSAIPTSQLAVQKFRSNTSVSQTQQLHDTTLFSNRHPLSNQTAIWCKLTLPKVFLVNVAFAATIVGSKSLKTLRSNSIENEVKAMLKTVEKLLATIRVRILLVMVAEFGSSRPMVVCFSTSFWDVILIACDSIFSI